MAIEYTFVICVYNFIACWEISLKCVKFVRSCGMIAIANLKKQSFECRSCKNKTASKSDCTKAKMSVCRLTILLVVSQVLLPYAAKLLVSPTIFSCLLTSSLLRVPAVPRASGHEYRYPYRFRFERKSGPSER